MNIGRAYINDSVFKWIFVMTILLVISSCVPQRKILYLQNTAKRRGADSIYFIKGDIKEKTIQSGDELYIRVTSSDEEITNFSARQETGVTDVSLLSYTVNENGFIKLPYIGNINVLNLTLHAASDSLETALSQYLYHPFVYIKYINKNVTIIGEVGNPGIYTFYEKDINIMQAIGYANDITTFGNRKKVLLVREQNNMITKHYIDLTKDNILTSDLYTLKSNDIIYVQPLKRKKWGMDTVPYNLFFTVISTTVLILTFIRYPF